MIILFTIFPRSDLKCFFFLFEDEMSRCYTGVKSADEFIEEPLVKPVLILNRRHTVDCSCARCRQALGLDRSIFGFDFYRFESKMDLTGSTWECYRCKHEDMWWSTVCPVCLSNRELKRKDISAEENMLRPPFFDCLITNQKAWFGERIIFIPGWKNFDVTLLLHVRTF